MASGDRLARNPDRGSSPGFGLTNRGESTFSGLRGVSVFSVRALRSVFNVPQFSTPNRRGQACEISQSPPMHRGTAGTCEEQHMDRRTGKGRNLSSRLALDTSGRIDAFLSKFQNVDQTLQVFAFYYALSAFGTSEIYLLNLCKSLILYLYIYYTT